MRAQIEDGVNYLLFDGACGICSRAAVVARGIDRKGLFQIIPYQSVGESLLARYGISREECNKRMYVISKGRVYPGALGANAFLLHYPPWAIMVILAYVLFPLVLLEMAAYAVIARNRRRISVWLGYTSCAIEKREESSPKAAE